MKIGVYISVSVQNISVSDQLVKSGIGASLVDDKGDLTHKGKYLMAVGELLRTYWNEDDIVGGKWDTLKLALCKGAETESGYCNLIGLGIVPPLVLLSHYWNRLWLSTQQQRDKHKFSAACANASQAVREAKEQWFSCKAEEAERGRHSGNILWRCIMVKDEERNVCSTSDEQQER